VELHDFLVIAQGYGAAGIIVAWFAWRDWRRDVRDEKRQAQRDALDQKRIDADLELARGYAVLATRLEALSHGRSS
jgi:hypothetical protein